MPLAVGSHRNAASVKAPTAISKSALAARGGRRCGGYRLTLLLARLVEERLSPDADVAVATAHERALSRSLGGRTVFDDMKPRGQRHRAGPSQLELFPPH
jgi:hypothetical protein